VVTPGSASGDDALTLTRTQRLDRLPFTRRHRGLLFGSGLGWALDAMDIGLVSFVIAALTLEWQLAPSESSLIVSIGFAGMAIGASLGGVLADRFGRRTVFALSLILFGVATGLSAAAFSVASLLVLRFLAGVGMGAELPVASTYMSEFAPSRIRGRVVVLLEAFWAVGWIIAALIGAFIVPLEHGWRWALLVGAVPALYAVAVRFRMPESVRFLERQGRFDEAEAVVHSLETEAGVAAPATAAADQGGTTGELGAAAGGQASSGIWQRLAALWAPGRKRITAALWAVWFCVNFSYYGAFIWIPSILVASGFELVNSFQFTLIITLAQLPGYLLAAWLIEVWGRRATLATFLVGSAASAVLFGTATEVWSIIAFGCALSFFNLGAWGALYAITPELYPTEIRGTGSGWAAGVGRIASIVAPLTVGPLLLAGGAPLLFVVFSAFFAVAAASALLLAERRGEVLD